jgi:wyosine [tRNA(Phe)-imidazoG37] synthetase (radical SAM superfamily)
MFDVDFYMNFDDECDPEAIRNETPVVYNIETTNACNMRCVMCPRTTLMTRPVVTMKPELFKRIVDQIEPHHELLWMEWEDYVEDTYGIDPDDMSENHFFLYIIPKVIQLHGYGEPLLDKNMGLYVELLANKGLLSYFSCNPANVNGSTSELFRRGLDYIKFSVESVDDETHRSIRGDVSNCRKLLDLINEKEQKRLSTRIIITMLDLNRGNQLEEFEKLKEYFKDTGSYVYFKSQDTQWLNNDYHGTKSIHWSEPCKHPWMSMTIKSNGEACQCMEDFNNAIVLGDTNKESLIDIWNGERYAKLRQDHLELTKGIQCTERCDMRLVGEYVGR